MRWGSASYRLERPAAGSLALRELLGDVGDDPKRTAQRQRSAELQRCA
jgi:hypothetical protein